MEQIRKLDAALRQLNAAITLLFHGADPIVVHTLAAAAANVFSDVIDKKPEKQSWRERIKCEHKLSEKQIKNIMNKSWNFFKHGDCDPDGVIEFDEKDSEYLIFHATLECGELEIASIEKDVFQLWFVAKNALDIDVEMLRVATTLFPDFIQLSRSQQLKVGAKKLAEEHASTSNL